MATIHQGLAAGRLAAGMFHKWSLGEKGMPYSSRIRIPSMTPAGKFSFTPVTEAESDKSLKTHYYEGELYAEIEQTNFATLRQLLWLSRVECESSCQVLGGGADANKFINFKSGDTATLGVSIEYVITDESTLAKITGKTRLTKAQYAQMQTISTAAYTGGAGTPVIAGSSYDRTTVITPGVKTVTITNSEGTAAVGYLGSSTVTIRTFGRDPIMPQNLILASGIEIEGEHLVLQNSANDVLAFITDAQEGRVGLLIELPDGQQIDIQKINVTTDEMINNEITGSGISLKYIIRIPFYGDYANTDIIDCSVGNANVLAVKSVVDVELSLS